MAFFRKKPVIIEAVQFFGLDVAENGCHSVHFDTDGPLPDWLRKALIDEEIFVALSDIDFIYIKTPEGLMEVGLGDWIIKGVKGEIYPCKPDIFHATYDPAPEPEQDISGVAI